MPIPAGSRYVAMGSSFAAGPGLPSRVPGSPRRAGRSTGNYAHLVARESGLDLHDVTFSGATTSDLLGPSAAGQAAQLDAVTPETSLVTITAGGNDVGFLPRLTLSSLPWPLPLLPPVKARVESLGQTRATDQRFEQLERNLTVIAATLAVTTQAAAGTVGWTYIAASAASADHHAWSAEPWTRRFHLSLRGGALVVAALRPGTSTDPEVH